MDDTRDVPEEVTEQITESAENAQQAENAEVDQVAENAAELAEEVAPTPSDNRALSQINMETLINRYVADLEKLRDELKSHKEMLEDAFRNDPKYAEQDEKVKAETRKRTEIKQNIIKQPSIAQLDEKVKHVKEEIKDTQAGLSAQLQQYYQSTGMNQIVSENGEVREIVVVTKLVKKGGKHSP